MKLNLSEIPEINEWEKPSFPKWAPSSAIAVWHYDLRETSESRISVARECLSDGYDLDGLRTFLAETKEEDFSTLRAIERLLSFYYMEPVWDSVVKNGIEPGLITMRIRTWMHGPIGSETKTKIEHRQWLSDVEKTANDLADLLETTNIDDVVWKSRHDDGVLFSGYLRDFAREAKNRAKYDLLLSKPNGQYAKRNYFICRLYDYFSGYFQKNLATIVALFTCAVFYLNHDNIESLERSVYRLIQNN